MASKRKAVEHQAIGSSITAAMRYSGRTQKLVAAQIGIRERSLQRYMDGSRRPSKLRHEAILEVCRLPSTTTIILAAKKLEHLIGTSEHGFLDVMFIGLLGAVEKASKDFPGLLNPGLAKLHALKTLKDIQETLSRIQTNKDTGQWGEHH